MSSGTRGRASGSSSGASEGRRSPGKEDSDSSPKGHKSRRSDTAEMAALLKIVPQLKEVGYDNWLKAFQIVAYSEEWYDEDGADLDEVG